MSSISQFMTGDHRRCDDIFADAERAAVGGDWTGAEAAFGRFADEVLHHFAAEEAVLFPGFERRTGMTQGPTQVMRYEHGQMRQLIDSARAAIAARDADAYAGNAETLLIMMQQHNMKEEGMLYPMCDQVLAGGDVLSELQTELAAVPA